MASSCLIPSNRGRLWDWRPWRHLRPKLSLLCPGSIDGMGRKWLRQEQISEGFFSRWVSKANDIVPLDSTLHSMVDDMKTLLHAVCHHKMNDLLDLLFEKGAYYRVSRDSGQSNLVFMSASSIAMLGNSAGWTAFQVAMQAEGIQGAIRAARKALESHPAGHPGRPNSLSYLANALAETRSLASWRESISLLREALELLPPDHPDIKAARDDLANVLGKTASSVDDRDESNSLHQGALDLRPPGHPNHLASLDGLACALLRKKKLAIISESCPFIEEALSLHPPSDDSPLHSVRDPPGALRGIQAAVWRSISVGAYRNIRKQSRCFEKPWTSSPSVMNIVGNFLGRSRTFSQR